MRHWEGAGSLDWGHPSCTDMGYVKIRVDRGVGVFRNYILIPNLNICMTLDGNPEN